MEKYGTQQFVAEDADVKGIYKVSAEKLAKCCVASMANLLPKQSATCECGNSIKLEKID